jgi:hypothetical protein
VHSLPALHPPLPLRTHVFDQIKHVDKVTTSAGSQSAAASPPNFELNHWVGARAASVSTTPTHRNMVQRIWFVLRSSIRQSQFYQARIAVQHEPSTKSRSSHAGPMLAAHHKRTAPTCSGARHRQHSKTNVYSLHPQHSHVLMVCTILHLTPHTQQLQASFAVSGCSRPHVCPTECYALRRCLVR